MYSDVVTESMRVAIDETERRRAIQMRFNEEHGIEPKTVRKAINDISSFISEADDTLDEKKRSRGDSFGHGEFYSPVEDEERSAASAALAEELSQLPREELLRVMQGLEEDMRAASAAMDFEQAALLRDRLVHLRAAVEGTSEDDVIARLRKDARKGSAFGGGRKRRGRGTKH